MEEVHHITKQEWAVKVIVPYLRSVWVFIDPMHNTFYFYTVDSFAYNDPDHIICQKYDCAIKRY